LGLLDTAAQDSAINDSNQIAGTIAISSPSPFIQHAATLNLADNSITDLGAFFSDRSVSQSADINNAGQVTGTSAINFTTGHAFLWSGGILHDLGDLPGGMDYSEGRSLNNRGQVVGASGAADNLHAFLWSESGGMADLGTLIGPSGFSEAAGVNDSGQVVGRSWFDTSGSGTHAFLWQESIGIVNLNNLVDTSDPLFGLITLYDARAINSSGWIVANGYYRNDPFAPETFHAFLLVPVPLPAAVWLFGSALVGLFGVSRLSRFGVT
jgi:probable HAF family extracellular repeat protein